LLIFILIIIGNKFNDWYCDDDNWYPIHWAACTSLECLELVCNAGADIEVKDAYDNTPLAIAANSNPECTLYLIHLGANLESKNNHGLTPLSHTLLHGHDNLNCVEMLLDHGANINAIDNKGQTPLDNCGSLHTNMECFKIILNRGGINGSRPFNEYKVQYQKLMKTRKDNYNNFVNDFVPYLPWRYKLEQQVLFSTGNLNLFIFF